ncbi:hypothetical protein LVD15_15340 [Fulvivirga maritima]|uniref:hypothetical protein n=1 Tax=Fulvivirga maritima TaxID=2904247 RepID=UPI001F2852E7|nr:hypothetical protein [Fulvivirga maritima]UII24688.1 hypothetical protein LVD15_15340 [Fulvivirga maritima]
MPKADKEKREEIGGRENEGQGNGGNAAFEDNRSKNQLAVTDPDKYVYKHAENNWFVVLRQFKNGELHHPEGPTQAAKEGPHGMQKLLDYRAKITEKLLNEVKTVAREDEVKKREEYFSHQKKEKNVIEQDEVEKMDVKLRALELDIKYDIKEVKGNVPGSTNPTSDIDVNLSGDGTEFAVKWLNETFKKRYGHGRESGVVYDVNFYAQDFVPKKVFDLKKKGKLKPDPNSKYFNNDSAWRTHVLTDEKAIERDIREQQEMAMLMMRVNMADDDWKAYKEASKYKASDEFKQDIAEQISKAEVNFSEREWMVNEAKKGNSSEANAGLTEESLSKIAPENREYERQLEANVLAARHKFQFWKYKLRNAPRDKEVKKKADDAYVELKTSKSIALAYANEAYYTQGSVIGVVVNKQMLDLMYKRNEGANFKKLQLSPAEYYHGFIEQIGFAMHSLHNTKSVPDLIKAGKYVHRAYNMFKHFCDVTQYLEYKIFFSEKESKAASQWEGVKQGKKYVDKRGFVAPLSQEVNVTLTSLLEDLLGKKDIQLNDLNQLIPQIKEKLIFLKVKFDHAWFGYRNKKKG